jgi:hypothetical protein
MRGWALALMFAGLPLGGSPAPRADAGAPYDDWYPGDITPPTGTQYPCALTALPRDLPGVPAADRRFINHVYSMILRATQAKLVLLRALGSTEGLQEPLERYLSATEEAKERIAAEAVPAGLDAFAGDVRAAIEKQQSFFRAAVESRSRGAEWNELFQHADGRAASQRLISAWSRMQQRYPQWSPELRESVYHHLCALDLF